MLLLMAKQLLSSIPINSDKRRYWFHNWPSGFVAITVLIVEIKIIHPSIHRSMGSAPVGAQFLGYRELALVSWAFARVGVHRPSLRLPYLDVFYSLSSPAIGFHSSIFYGGGICTTPPTLLLIPDLGLALW